MLAAAPESIEGLTSPIPIRTHPTSWFWVLWEKVFLLFEVVHYPQYILNNIRVSFCLLLKVI